jgi:RimJ/RimL family protein N-acetyltransferase/catechol 2,3-dioxygenase-like lactoylglutathione lyase family enzyme
MPQLGLVTVVVRDYDEAIAFYVNAVGFELVEDTRIDDEKRWVVVAPPGTREVPGARAAGVLLARAATPEQSDRIGDQTGGRVGWFLNTEDFDGDYARMRAAGVVFEGAPRHEPYGTVAVFRDLYGNRWDLIRPRGTEARPLESAASWPVATPLTTTRLRLEPLRADHAQEAFPVLDDVRLHTWTGGAPCSLDQLEARYRRQSAGQSPDGTQGWLNWMLRRLPDGQLVGTVQATLHRPAAGRLTAELAWVVGSGCQGNGYAREGALAMAGWLHDHGVDTLIAHIHPDHAASAAVARALGLAPTDTVVDGEIRWTDGADR